MTKPEMIIFDYGNTLMFEGELDAQKGTEAVMSLVSKNPGGLDSGEFALSMMMTFAAIEKTAGKSGIDIPGAQIIKIVAERLGVEFGVPHEEVEEAFWENASPGTLMPGIGELLKLIKSKNIRSAVISNLPFSGGTLGRRISKNIPENNFEFIMTSSDYIYKKPNSFIYEIALKKAGLPSDKVWYCGDSVNADVKGSHAVGIFPVLYDSPIIGQPRKKADIDAEFEFLHINEWSEMIEVLERL